MLGQRLPAAYSRNNLDSAYRVGSERHYGYRGGVGRPDFPKSLKEFQARSRDDEACRPYLAARAMVNPDREPLKDKVEVDETYLRGHEAGLKGGRQLLLAKAVAVSAVEVCEKAASRVHLRVVANALAASLCGFVKATVTPQAPLTSR
jgi:hypothetical protein